MAPDDLSPRAVLLAQASQQHARMAEPREGLWPHPALGDAPVDGQTRRYVDALSRLGPSDYDALTAAEARAAMQDGAWQPPAHTEAIDFGRGVHGVLYPPGQRGAEGLPGLLLYLHGGGFVLGDSGTAHPICAHLAAAAGCYVLSLGYRLAPEQPFPAAVEDSLTALRWAADQASSRGWDPERLAVGGQSAGGNLAAVAAQQWRTAVGPPLRLQLLLCPLTDFRAGRHASRERMAHNIVLCADGIAWFEQRYLGPRVDRADPRASPLAAGDLRGLPPAYVVIAAGDPLRDEGEAYAFAMARAQVPVTLKRYPSVHGFVSHYETLAVGREALDGCVVALRSALRGSGR